MSRQTEPDGMRAARAVDALRRGWTIEVVGADGAIKLRAVETLYGTDNNLDAATGLLVSANRAATLKIVNQRDAADGLRPVLIALPGGATIAKVHAIADPALDLANPMKGPFRALPLDHVSAAEAALSLARHAGLLPACLLLPDDLAAAQSVNVDDLATFDDAASLVVAARARLPVDAAEQAEIIAFRSAADATEHVALVVGTRDESAPLVRIHSECLTGDVFGSLKCDCGPQLHDALRAMAGAQWGILLYLRQEGRGIGLINKLRAYMLQDQGFDTVDANTRLGFAVDARDFSVAAQMLRLMGVERVCLLTNNPEKVAGLERQGIAILERVPLTIASNPHNEKYLATKRDRTGHQL